MLNKRKYTIISVTVVLLLAFAAIYWFFDPAEAGWMPRCLWKMTTGTDCPGCGTQRMAHALMHGDLRAAWHANAYALCALPIIAFLLWLEFARNRHPRLYAKAHHPIIITILLVSILAWWLLRNLL